VRLRPVLPLLPLLAVSLAGLALLGAWPPLRAGLLETGRLLTAGDLAGVREYLRGFGPWAPAVAFVLIQVQAVLAPLPSFPVIYATGFLFGTVWGGLLSWISVLVSAALYFGLARRWGRPLVERVVSPQALRRADALFLRHGVFAVLLARLLPLTAFDLLSYAAGLTPMRLLPFLVATAIGMTPATFLMAWAGDLGGISPRALVGWTLALGTLAGGAAWLRPRVCARLGVPAPAAEPEG
jgi:uncharacterized membrane protein YdjX (TVP38/TMEM64 family)